MLLSSYCVLIAYIFDLSRNYHIFFLTQEEKACYFLTDSMDDSSTNAGYN